MKIACIALAQIPSDRANTIHTMKVCQAFAQMGHEVTLIVSEGPASSEERAWESLASHYGLRTRFNIVWLPLSPRWKRRDFTWKSVRYARQIGADFLYVRPIPPAVVGLIRHMPVMLEMHDLPTGFGEWWYRFFLRIPGRKRLLPVTRALQLALERRYGQTLPLENVIIAPNGVDLEQFVSLPGPATARRQLGFPPAPTVVCTGHLYAGRGADLFLALAQNRPLVRFVWVGGRPEDVEKWKSRAAEKGIANITYTGFISNERVPLYQAAADALLMPYSRVIGISGGFGNSAEISSPMKMFEYMAAGRAIISSDLPVIREVLNEKNAVLCPPEDVSAWQAALDALLSDPARRAALACQARADVESYTWIERARRVLVGFGFGA